MDEILLTKLKGLFATNKLEAFFDGISLLQKYPKNANIILKLLVYLYSVIPNEHLIELSPLLLDSLARHRGIIEIEDFHRALEQNGRENEIWRFLSAFDIKPSMIHYYKDFKFDETILSCLIPANLAFQEISGIILDFPSLSSTIHKIAGKGSVPFIISVINKLDNDQLIEIHNQVLGSGSYLEFLIATRLHEPISYTSMSEPFYFLDRTKILKEWIAASKISEILELDEENRYCLKQISGPTDLSAKLLKPVLDTIEQTELLTQFHRNLDQAKPDQPFAQFSELGLSIAKKISSEFDRLRSIRNENASLISTFDSTRALNRNEIGVNLSDKCDICKQRLGHCEVHAFSCGHRFHSDCVADIESEILLASNHIDTIKATEIGCPICGLNSSHTVCCLLWKDSQSIQFWSLNV